MTYLIALLARWRGLPPWVHDVAAVLAGLAVASALYAAISHHAAQLQKAADDAEARAAVAEAAAIDARAKEAAAVQRQTDGRAARQLQDELRGTYAKLPDEAVGPVRRALNCRRLRDTPAARGAEFSQLCGPRP